MGAIATYIDRAFRNLKGSYFVFLLLIFFFGIGALLITPSFASLHHVLLALSFWHGNLNFIFDPQLFVYEDIAFFNGLYYWPFGPLLAILYTPLAPLIETFHWWQLQSWTLILLNLWIIYSIMRIGQRLFLSVNTSLWFVIAFMYGSVFMVISYYSFNAFLSQVVAAALTFAALAEYFGRRRWIIIGICIALTLLSRTSAAFVIIFFGAAIFFLEDKTRWSSCVKLALPFGVAGLLLALYNFFRFGSALESGYAYQLMTNEVAEHRAIGFFSVAHISRNAYLLFVALPDIVREQGKIVFPFLKPSPWGMSIFLTSPYVIYLLFVNWKDRLIQLLGLTSLMILGLLLPLFLSGYIQLGYRYALDFFPLVFLILMYSVAKGRLKLTPLFKTLIVIAALLNLYFVLFAFFPIEFHA